MFFFLLGILLANELLLQLVLTENSDQFDIFINVIGGGLSGQAGAIKHGISRALLEASEELRTQLKKEGFLKETNECLGCIHDGMIVMITLLYIITGK